MLFIPNLFRGVLNLPFDGVLAKSAVNELSEILTGGRIEKVFQPEADEINISIRSKNQNLRLVLSASANYPRIHLTDSVKENPLTPPVFCMLLRKYLSGGKITGIDFYDYERLIGIRIESLNELGDLSTKNLLIEIMGRYSNIILVNQENKIIDSIKHVDSEISSVREVMPGRAYEMPPQQNKTSPERLDVHKLVEEARNMPAGVEKYLLNTIKGFSPLLCNELCFRAGIDGKKPASDLSPVESEQLEKVLGEMLARITASAFSPCIIYKDSNEDIPLDFHCISILQYENVKQYSSINSVMDLFYAKKDASERLKQKKSDINKVLNTCLDRCNKKLSIQQETISEVSNRDSLKLFGELITANIYAIPKGVKSARLLNYYSEDSEYLDIPMDENLTPQENAQRYYKKYSKAKSTFINTSQQLEESQKELQYLENVYQLLDNCITVHEIDEVREELIEQGYMRARKRRASGKNVKPSAPLHFRSSDGLDIFVGKNNKQNDQLTLKQSSSGDIWLHTRNIPGSHVIIKKLQGEVSPGTLLEAGILAAFHSKARQSSNVPVDYTMVKYVKKPAGAKPGMVIYENFKTMIVNPDENLVEKLKPDSSLP
jgi:predicted ribosome quality control (RQC) complex YloA/Tae2 family protein